MQMGLVRRSVGALLAVIVLLGAVPVGAAEKSAPRHSAQAIGKAERAMQEITAQAARESAGDEVQVVAACGGMAGERGAKAAAGAGDEEGEHGVFLFVCGGFGFRLFVLQMCLARRCNAV